MWSAYIFPLEFAEIDGVVKNAFWTLISGLAEYQRLYPEFYGQIEHELEWVNVTHFRSANNCLTAEHRLIHRVIRFLESSANGIPVKLYVIRFNGGLPGEEIYYDGIPGDVYFVRIYGAEPYSMVSLRDVHLRAQSLYSLQLAKPPAARREKLRLKLQRKIGSTSDPCWTAIYNFLYH